MLVFLAAFMPMEDFILKFLPGPDTLYFVSRFISELMIYGTAAWLVFHKLSLRESFCRTPVDGFLLAMASICVISLILNLGEDPLQTGFQGVLNLRPMFRYVVLFYVIVNTPLSPRQVNTIIYAIIFSGAVQVLFGLGQFAAGGALDSFLAPRITDIEVGGDVRRSRILQESRELGSIHGSAADTEFYALAMTVVFLVCFAKLRSRLTFLLTSKKDAFEGNISKHSYLTTKIDIFLIILTPLVVLADLLTYVRASVATIAVLVALESFFWFGRKISLFFGMLAMVMLILVLIVFPPSWSGGGANIRLTKINPFVDFTSIFTFDYLEQNLTNQRLHQLVRITPTVLLSRPIFGYGPNEIDVVAAVNSAEPSFLLREISENEFQDVYWVAILAKYGLAGLLTFIAIFYLLFRSGKQVYTTTKKPVLKEVSLMVVYMVIVATLMMFFTRSIEIRVFGFYLWLLPGLMFSLINQYYRKAAGNPEYSS